MASSQPTALSSSSSPSSLTDDAAHPSSGRDSVVVPQGANVELRISEPQPRTSESSDDGILISPAAARRFARRNMRRTSPTPDLVTSLVRPPSPEAFYVSGQAQSRARQGGRPGFRTGRSLTLDLLTGVPRQGRRLGTQPVPHLSSLDIPAWHGGNYVFDLYSLVYVSEPDPNLLCPICHDPLVDPVTTPCDHTFCYRCLRRSIASSPSGTACPIDRDPLRWSDCVSAARLIRTQLNGLLVKCPHLSRGCDKEMRREAIEKHATEECRFRDYHCPSESCDKRVRQKPMDDVCQHFQTQCKYCKEDIESADSEKHLLSCSKAKTRCESCWEMVTRSSMPSHRELDCDGVEVGCTYQDLGCPARMERGHLEEHSMACAFHPETASGIVIRSQRDVILSYNDLGSQVRDLQNRHDETLRRLDDLSETTGRRGNANTVIGDNRTMQDLDAGFEEVHQNLTHLEARQSMWTLNQVMPIREEVTELRNNINMIRMHVNWLLNRSREEGRLRAANSSAAATTLRHDAAEASGMPPERRRSSGAEADVPRL